MQASHSRHTASAATPSPSATGPSSSAAAPSPGAAKPLLLVVGIALLRPAAAGSHGGASGDDGSGSAGSAGAAASVLLAQRPPGKANAGLWEFPGGKVEAGETPERALVRELQEELGIKVEECDLRPLSFASHSYPGFHLLMPLYGCTRWSGEPVGAEGQAVVWASEAQVLAGAEQRGMGDDSSWFPLTAADVPLVPDVVRALRQCSQKV